MIKIKRVYDPPEKDDGCRILVDRLWPRGMSKERLKADLWMKDVGPSNELRKWFAHDPQKWPEFSSKYEKELEQKADLLRKIVELESKSHIVTLIYSAKDEKHNQAVVLQDVLTKRKRHDAKS